MLGQLPREEESDSGLDLPEGDGGHLVVVDKLGGLSSDPCKKVVDKGVHDDSFGSLASSFSLGLGRHVVGWPSSVI